MSNFVTQLNSSGIELYVIVTILIFFFITNILFFKCIYENFHLFVYFHTVGIKLHYAVCHALCRSVKFVAHPDDIVCYALQFTLV